MEIQFDITRKFEKDLAKLSKDDQRSVAINIDKYAASFDIERGDPSGHIFQLQKIHLPEGLDSSLYVLRVSKKLRVILTIEEDPLFERKLITLIRVVTHDSLDNTFQSISESLYQQLLNIKPIEGQ